MDVNDEGARAVDNETAVSLLPGVVMPEGELG